MEHMKERADRFNEGKLKWSLVDFKAIESLPQVLMFGTHKYSEDNWKKGLDMKEILDSMMRHLTAVIDGELIDPESGLLHMGHLMCNCMFWTHFYQKEQSKLDLYNNKMSDGDYQRIPTEQDAIAISFAKHVEVLVKKFPNDSELGQSVRSWFGDRTKEVFGILEKEMD